MFVCTTPIAVPTIIVATAIQPSTAVHSHGERRRAP